MRVAIATCSAVPGGLDDAVLADALRRAGAGDAELVVWDDPGAAWGDYDRVLIRSPWDYTRRLGDFLRWAEGIGPALRNPPELVRWNSDKRYLADLASGGVPVVPTVYAGPGDGPPALAGEVVVKPTVSAGARDTGRFGPASHDRARALVDRIRAGGRTAMVQPYLPDVDVRGETAVVLFAGEPSHVLRKRAVLAPDEVAPVLEGELGVAKVMRDPDLVAPGTASPDELALAGRVVASAAARFGRPPLVARVDMVPGPDGGPVLLELEAIEPALYFEQAPGSADRLARALLAEG